MPSFSTIARDYIKGIFNSGKPRRAKDLLSALISLENYLGTSDIPLSLLTPLRLNRWINSLYNTTRVKKNYPLWVKKIYYATINDKTLSNPWLKVSIPEFTTHEQQAISIQELNNFFNLSLPESRMRYPINELGQDIAFLIFCLAGINTIDLYELRKENYNQGHLHYRRAKTQTIVDLQIPAIIQPMIDKYLNKSSDDDHLFNFYQRSSSSVCFGVSVNTGIKQVCELLGIYGNDTYSTYTFRRSWEIIANSISNADEELSKLNMQVLIKSFSID